MLIAHATELELCTTADALWAGAVKVLAEAGFEHAVYLSVNSEFEDLFVRSTMSDLYNISPPKEDPFLIHACTSYKHLKVGTEFLSEHTYISDTDRAFIERASEQGFHAGLALPMRLKGSERFGGFVIGNSMDRAQFLKRMMPRAQEVGLFCMIIHRRIEELIACRATPDEKSDRHALTPNALPPAFDPLTPRETEVLLLLAQGQTRKATAHICDLSVHTVSDYAKNGYRKLGVRNRAEVATILYGQTKVYH